MDKLEHFVRVRTNQVEQSNYQYALRQFFDAAAANYTKKPTTAKRGGKAVVMLKDFTISNLLDLNETIVCNNHSKEKHTRGKCFRRSENLS